MWWCRTSIPALRSQRQKRDSSVWAVLRVLDHPGLLISRSLSKKKREGGERKGEERMREGKGCMVGGRKN